MKYIARKKPWLSWVLCLNFLFMQFFFIRIARICEHVKNGNREGEIILAQTTWRILKWIVPFTGWWSKYIYLNKKKRSLFLYRLKNPKYIAHLSAKVIK